VYWFDDKDDVSRFDFSNSLFITETQVDEKIPLREDCFYILHNCTKAKYRPFLLLKKAMHLRVYTDDVLSVRTAVKIAPCIYYDLPNRTLYMPWATDLLPHEIDAVKKQIPLVQKKHEIWWIGTIGDQLYGNINQLQPFMQAAQKDGVLFLHNDPWAHGISAEENRKRIQSSFMAPAIVGKWQMEHGYIPCRIFKNISYGSPGITNSYRVYELFQRKIVYNPDTYQLFYDAKNFMATMTMQQLYDQMDFVRDHHTYINRIHTIFDFIKKSSQ
jgi:hypothetical protein